MSISFKDIGEIYLVTGYTDLRKGIDGYAGIVQNTLKLAPFQDKLFIFCNQQRNKIKCLYWDKTGFWLLYKRLETGHFKWKKDSTTGTVIITETQLMWLLSGLKTDSKTSIKETSPKYV